MAVHPHHHLQDQQAGAEHHGGLEPFAGRPCQPLSGQHEERGQRTGQRDAQRHAAPEHAQAPRRLGAMAEPGMQDADDQKRLDAFAPDDEQGLQHG
ncbi:hypothetical protein D3C81_1955990 [compost metagenome]